MVIEVTELGATWRAQARDENRLVEIFHAVRRLPYASTGERNPAQVVRAGRGSCSGKHILLRDLLVEAGYKACVTTIRGDLAAAMPAAADFPDELQRLIDAGDVPDFHHYVSVDIDGRTVVLDATWHDQVAAFGFPVNHDWDGKGDTRVAVTPSEVLETVEDVAGYKASLIATLSTTQRDRRRRFLELLTTWIENIEGRART